MKCLRRHWATWLLALALVLGPAHFAPAADPSKGEGKGESGEVAQELLERFGLVRKASPYQRDSSGVKSAFASVVAAAKPGTVRVLNQGKQIALGAVVDARGYVA